MELPAEIREQIWIYAVTDWEPAGRGMLEKQPIRVNNLNRPLPPTVTLANRQVRAESLYIYYAHNTFETWLPFVWHRDWTQSTIVMWLDSIGPEKAWWIEDIVLLYKAEWELDNDVERAIWDIAYAFKDGVVRFRQELSELEMRYEEWGLPTSFGKKRYT